jgi:galactokinase
MHDSAVFRSMHTARFEAEPVIYVAPGRVNLIGEHTDYAEGFVMPAAINFATLAGISPRGDGKIAIFSENYGQVRYFDAAELPPADSASAFGGMYRWVRACRVRRRSRWPRRWR